MNVTITMRRNTLRYRALRLVLFGLAAITAGCVESRLGGMTVQEAFPDPRVAALVQAVSSGDFAEADKGFKAGANVNAIGTDGVSPLIWVMSTTKNLERTEYMLKAGANPNYRDEKRGGSAIYLAAGGNMPEMLELLLKYKGDPSLPGPKGALPLRTALFQEREENIRILVKYGAAMHNDNPMSESVANAAVGLGRFDLVVYFLDQGLNHNLDGLAISVFAAHVPQNSEQQRWKDKVIEMLKARGVKYPPDWPRKR